MENEDRWEAEANRLDIQNRIRNLMWTVSQDYELDIEVDPEAWQKSKYIAFYDAVRQDVYKRQTVYHRSAVHLCSGIFPETWT